MSEILERIEREAGVPGLAKLLAERLGPTDLQSLLLEVYRLRARQRSPSDLLADYVTNRFVRPSAAPPKRLLQWESVAVSQLRAQRFEGPSHFAHFGLFGLCSAGRDQGGMRFELAALGLHARFYLRALRAFLGPDVPLQLSASDFAPDRRDSLLESELLSPIREEFAGVECVIDSERTEGRGYYPDFCFNVRATNRSGRALTLVDGGSVDWTQRLLSNRKERLVTSGIGSERVCVEFGAAGITSEAAEPNLR